MTHCSCFLCQSCFKSFFSAAIKERSIDQLVCPQCSKPEISSQGGMEESMDYFNLLDTQVEGLAARPDIQNLGRSGLMFHPVSSHLSVDPSLPASSDPRTVPEETPRSSSAGDAQLLLVCSCKSSAVCYLGWSAEPSVVLECFSVRSACCTKPPASGWTVPAVRRAPVLSADLL